MDIDTYIQSVRRQLELSVEAGGDESRDAARRLIAPLESAIRLSVQDALAAAAEEITLELAPGAVELRLRGREPEFVVSLPPTDPGAEDAEGQVAAPSTWLGRGSGSGDVGEDDSALSRINLRLPERLKARVEEAAAEDGLSVNAWLVRAAATAVERRGPAVRRDVRTPHGAQRYTGWAR
ncbi:MAG TPA: toxin-antitoxin system HicB family antitoxin [Actinomycetota bacterium]|nr:toxin-antitoxin system HicB family antitoxin [Actinomycetota bacterium]